VRSESDPGAAIEVRVALRSCIGAMHRIRMAVRENRLVSMVIEAADYQREIEVTGRGFVAAIDGELAGFAVGNACDGNIWALFVDPRFEGRGVGRALHDVLVAWLFGAGLQRLWLTTDLDTRAARLYRAALDGRHSRLYHSLDVPRCSPTAPMMRCSSAASGAGWTAA
jgi:GNAT superfamily N-acetyltransferase